MPDALQIKVNGVIKWDIGRHKDEVSKRILIKEKIRLQIKYQILCWRLFYTVYRWKTSVGKEKKERHRIYYFYDRKTI